MASNEVSANNSGYQYTGVAPSGSSIYYVPEELIQNIFQHLSATDLCHMASCSRRLRDATNQDSFWRSLCQRSGWEHYGTTTDLAKIASYGPPEQATGATEASNYSITFQNDRIVTDDNTTGLTSTCRWKGVYMRAYHLDRNWARNRSHFKDIALLHLPSYTKYKASVDGDLLAFGVTPTSIHVYDIRKGIIDCVITVKTYHSGFKIKNGVLVVRGLDAVRAFSVKAGRELNMMRGCQHYDVRLPLLFDGEFVLTCPEDNKSSCIDVWDIQDGKQRTLTDVTMNQSTIRDWDYRDKVVVAVYDNKYILVWDARSGECLHKLPCGALPQVKLGNNVIVCVSLNENEDKWLVNILSRNTGECQRVISGTNSWSPPPRLINSLIVVEIIPEMFKGFYGPRPCNIRGIYDLSGNLVTHRMDSRFGPSELSVHEHTSGVNGSKCPFVTRDRTYGGNKAFIFNVTANGLVRLFALDHEPDVVKIIWIDETRMILYDQRKFRFLIHHYW